MRVVSLVPSLTEAVAALGAPDDLVGVTRYCTHGAPAGATRVGGTKNPDVAAVRALAPDLILGNTEENRLVDLQALRDAGLAVWETFPRTVADVGPLLVELAERLGRPGADAGIVETLEAALADAADRRPRTPVLALTLIWRKPWMALGPDTFADDLLARCGFVNALVGADERYPRLDPALRLRPEVVLLPSEPYAFGETDLPAVADLVPGAPTRLVDGRLLTWHGPSTPDALREFADLAAALAS